MIDLSIDVEPRTRAEPTPRTPDPDTIFDRIRGGMFEARLHRGFELMGRGEDDDRRHGRWGG